MSTSVPWSTVTRPKLADSAEGIGLRPERIRPRSLSELAALIGADRFGPDLCVSGISSNSALVADGDLFAALPGATAHGIRYAPAAVRAGAVAVLTDPAGAAELRELGSAEAGSAEAGSAEVGSADVPVLVVADPRAVLGELSAEMYGHPARALRVLGVTGTSGKTTTTFLVRAGLEAAGISSGIVGTVGVFAGDVLVKTPFTTPEAPQLQGLLAVMRERDIECVAMEVSSHALRMGRVDGTEFAVGAFTNLSQDHLDFHSDMEDYFAAKALLFDGRARREIVVVDDEWGRRLVTEDTVTVSTQANADWRATDVTVMPDGSTRFTVHGPVRSFAAGCRIPGAYNVANTLLAFAILSESGVDAAAVAPAVASAQVRGRMERVDGDQQFLAVVDYSHKPAGVAGALRALRPLTAGRLIMVLGCGGDRDRGKRPVMGEVAARNCDVLIITDDNPRTEVPAEIRAAMLTGARSVPAGEAAEILEEGNRRAAIAQAIALAEPGDTVLIAGKGHETGQEVGGSVLPFDDVSVVQQCLREQGFRAETAGGEISATADVETAR
jgi:UDP-N-acetylmuramoyl-L-alanyl-D-glutamate--2,6-diaminopimelate ligase